MAGRRDRDPFAARDAARATVRQALYPGAMSAPSAATKPSAGASRAMGKVAAVALAGAAAVFLVGLAVVLRQGNGPPRPALHAERRAFVPPASEAAPAPLLIDGTEDEAALLAEPTTSLRLFRLSEAPSVLVLLFPSLHAQALALNRLGAFVEKSGVSRDRVLSDAELAGVIAAAHNRFDTYYYGHDYRAADLARFFALADQDTIALRPEERALRDRLGGLGLLRPGAVGAIVSVPPLSQAPPVGQDDRRTILTHEVSHGVYFTDLAYAGYTDLFWRQVMTAAQRAAFRHFLGQEGYDMANEDLMRNEMQAYVIFTRVGKYFDPALAGLTGGDAAALRARFLAGMPAGWLRDEALSTP
jgi:hypothetical protein